jgi:hypothetical protein
MKQTAVGYIVKEFSEILGKIQTDGLQDLLLVDAINKARQMERQQIIDAVQIGYAERIHSENDGKSNFTGGHQYYDKTFSQTTPWYDEEQTTDRMDIIGQNGNDGEHYKNK